MILFLKLSIFYLNVACYYLETAHQARTFCKRQLLLAEERRPSMICVSSWPTDSVFGCVRVVTWRRRHDVRRTRRHVRRSRRHVRRSWRRVWRWRRHVTCRRVQHAALMARRPVTVVHGASPSVTAAAVKQRRQNAFSIYATNVGKFIVDRLKVIEKLIT